MGNSVRVAPSGDRDLLLETADATKKELWINVAMMASNPTPGGVIVTGNAQFSVGTSFDAGGSPSEFFSGSVDEAAFYDYVLGEGQIAAHFIGWHDR